MVESNSMRFHTPSAFKTESSPAELTFHNLVPDSGNDPLAYRLSSDCSTSELIGNIWYQELDSNQPHPVLQTGALPDELSWHNILWGDYWELNPDKRNHNPRLYH